MLLAEGGSDKKTFARGSFSALPEASGIQNKAILNCQEQGSDTYYKELLQARRPGRLHRYSSPLVQS